MSESLPLYISIPVAWNLIGGLILVIFFANTCDYFSDDNVVLTYSWVRRRFCNLTVSGAIICCILLNLLCPVFTLLFWSYYGFVVTFTKENKKEETVSLKHLIDMFDGLTDTFNKSMLAIMEKLESAKNEGVEEEILKHRTALETTRSAKEIVDLFAFEYFNIANKGMNFNDYADNVNPKLTAESCPESYYAMR